MDTGFESAISVGNYSSAVFGHYYPADVLRSVKGMKVASIDVFISEAPESAAIEIYGPYSQDASGALLYQQSFTPKADSMNHIVLDKTLEITGDDMWFGVRINGMESGKYYIGIDGSTAVQGYGDMINVGGNGWWSLTDLGQKHNLCVRINLTGERTPEISWINLDKKDFTVEPGGFVDDLLSPEYTIPVYMTNGILNAINTIDATRVNVKMVGNDLVLESAALIEAVNVYDLTGALVDRKAVNEYCSVVSLGNLASGVYVVNIIYADGATETIKAGIMK